MKHASEDVIFGKGR